MHDIQVPIPARTDSIQPRTKRPSPKRKATKQRQQAEALLRQRRLATARSNSNPGLGLLEECRILHEVIRPEVLAEEPNAQSTRWVEYGYINAFKATEAFTKAYVEIYPALRQRYVSSDPHDCPVTPEFVLNDAGTMNALYRARQFADLMGMPYRPFIRALGDALITEGGYKRVPLPNHLYPGKKDKALRHGLRQTDRLIELNGPRAFQGDLDPRFLAVNYRGDPPQDRALEALCLFTKTGVVRAGRLRGHLQRGLISVADADRLFPEPIYQDVIDTMRASATLGSTATPLSAYRPHCFGLHDEHAPECAACPMVAKCATMVALVQKELVRYTGSADPRKARERELARKRKRAQRERNKQEVLNRAEEGEESVVMVDPNENLSPKRAET